MFLKPKKIKFKKFMLKPMKGFSHKNNKITFGEFGLKAVDSGFISARQLEAARRSISRKVGRKGKLWIRVFPHFSITKKPNESRMGKGVGSIFFWAARVRCGEIVFEICGVPEKEARKALSSGGYKIPVKTKVMK